MGNIYDGAFRTMLNDCRKLIIPVINEIFGETYTGEEEIQFFPSEHFIDQQDEADKERITDTNFTTDFSPNVHKFMGRAIQVRIINLCTSDKKSSRKIRYKENPRVH